MIVWKSSSSINTREIQCGTRCALLMIFGVSILTPLSCTASTAQRSSSWRVKPWNFVSKQLHQISASMAWMGTPSASPKSHGSRPWMCITATSKAFVHHRQQCPQASHQESHRANLVGHHSLLRRQNHLGSPVANPAWRLLHLPPRLRVMVHQ